ncbi:MAG: hypothetical protein QOI66_4933 [Myxococcales bacterium]|jgi:hypothetical protein|nr:hypothetical protein [Myxococcales bacterium]
MDCVWADDGIKRKTAGRPSNAGGIYHKDPGKTLPVLCDV